MRSGNRFGLSTTVSPAQMPANANRGLLFGSIELVADGLHMSTHASALLLAAVAYSYVHASQSVWLEAKVLPPTRA